MNKKLLSSIALFVLALILSKIPLLSMIGFGVATKLASDAKKEIQSVKGKGLTTAKVVYVLSAILFAIGLFSFLAGIIIGLNNPSFLE